MITSKNLIFVPFCGKSWIVRYVQGCYENNYTSYKLPKLIDKMLVLYAVIITSNCECMDENNIFVIDKSLVKANNLFH